MKQLYIIEYDSMHWCGGTSHCVAWADSEDEAVEVASMHMEDYMFDLFADEIADQEYTHGTGISEEQQHNVVFCKLLEGSEFEEYYADPVQRLNFYPCVNPEDAV